MDNINDIINNNNNNNNNNHLEHNKNNCTKLELAVLNNYYDKVIDLLNNDNFIYYHENKICKKLCNGIIVDNHECKKEICFKTALYYSLINNYKCYSTLYDIVKKMYKVDPKLRRSCKCCDNKMPKQSIIFNSMIDGFLALNCVCKHKYNYLQYYSENFLNFNEVYDILYDDLGNSSNLRKFRIFCTKILNIKKTNDKSDENNNDNNCNNVKLKNFDLCIHDDVTFYFLEYCAKNENNNDKIRKTDKLNKIRELAKEFLIVSDFYEENCKIVKLLLNQQILEIFNYSISQVSNEKDMIQVFENITKGIDVFLDINYQNDSLGDIMNILCNNKDWNIIAQMILNKGYDNDISKCINTSLANKFYKLFDLFLTNIDDSKFKSNLDIDNLDNELIKNILLIGEFDNKVNKNIEDRKLDYINILIKLGYLDKYEIANSIIDIVIINCSNNDLIEGIIDLIEINKINANVTKNTFRNVIKYSNMSIFKHLLHYNYKNDNGANNLLFNDLIFDVLELKDNEKMEDFVNIFIDNFSKIDKKELNKIVNSNNETPLHIICKNNLTLLFDKFIKLFDVFKKDHDGNTALMTSIINSNYEMTKKLTNAKTQINDIWLINIPNNNKVKPIQECLNCENPYQMLCILLNSEGIDMKWDGYDKFVFNIFDILNNENNKIDMFDKLNEYYQCHEMMNIVDKSNKTLIIKAIENDEFQFVKAILIYFIEKKLLIVKINNEIIDDFEIVDILQNSVIIEYNINYHTNYHTNVNANYFPAVLMYVKQKLLILSEKIFENTNANTNAIEKRDSRMPNLSEFNTPNTPKTLEFPKLPELPELPDSPDFEDSIDSIDSIDSVNSSSSLVSCCSDCSHNNLDNDLDNNLDNYLSKTNGQDIVNIRIVVMIIIISLIVLILNYYYYYGYINSNKKKHLREKDIFIKKSDISEFTEEIELDIDTDSMISSKRRTDYSEKLNKFI